MKIVVAYRAVDGIAGGVERMSSTLMNELCQRGHEVHFYTIDQKEAKSYYEMDPRIQWHKLDMGDYRHKARWGLRIKRALKARRIFKAIEPDIILAFQDGAFLSTRLYTIFTGIPVILAERISPQHFDYTKSGKYKNLLQQTYRLAKKITIQCKSYEPLYPDYLQDKLVTISNPVFPAQKYAAPDTSIDGKKILLCVGRLGYQKNQYLLTEAFLEIADQYPNWILRLAGDGDETKSIKALVNSHKQVELLGNVKDTEMLYCNAHLFCLPSRWEGFPNALAEALAHGLPAVGFAECGGVRDLIQHGQNGLLAKGAESKQALQESLCALMDNDDTRSLMGQAAIESVKPYRPSKVFDQWENFLRKEAGS